MEHFNANKLSGDVMSISKSGFTLATVNVGAGGTEYTELHSVVLPKKSQPDWLKEGGRCEFYGALARRLGKTVIVATADTMTQPTEDDDYVNVAQLIGEICSPYKYYPRSENKMALGILLVTVKKAAYLVKLFDAHAVAWSRFVKRGAEVKIQGMLRNRSYVDNNGDTANMLEIIADPDNCKVLKSAEDNDPFAAMKASASGGTPATATGPAF